MQGQQTLEEVETATRTAIDAFEPFIEEASVDLEMPEEDLALFLEHLAGRKKMLDVGCGWAYYVNEFLKAGVAYTGIDLSYKMVERACASHPELDFREMSFRSLDFPTATFDGLWCCCVLGHEPKRNIQNVLKEMRRVLKPGGILLIVLPYSEWGDEYEAPIHEKIPLQTHYSVWDFQEFSEQVDDAGFRTLRSFSRHHNGSMTFLLEK